MPVFTHLRALIVGVALLLGVMVVVSAPATAAGTTFTWQGRFGDPSADDHSWTDPLNWSPQGVPGDGDSVVIAPPAQSACGAHVDSVPDNLALQNFTLYETQFGPNGLCEASVSGGSITVAGAFALDSGQIDTPMTLLASSTGTIAPGSGVLDSSTLSQNLTVQGTLTIDGNQDLSTSAGQGVLLYEGVSLTVAKGGELDADDSNDINSLGCCVNPSRVVDNGLVRVNGGQLRFDAVEFDQNGQLDTTSAGQVRTTSAPSFAADGATYTGDGSWLTWDATMVLTGVQTLGAGFHLMLGGVDPSGNESLGGTFSLAGAGTLDWDGGLIEADFLIDHGVTMEADGPTSGTNDHRELAGQDGTSSTPSAPVSVTNHGTIEFTGNADLYGTFDGAIDNQNDGTVSLAPGTALSSGSAASIVNDGGRVVVPSAGSSDPVVLDGFGYAAEGGSLGIAAGDQLQLVDGADSRFATTTVSGGGALLLSSPAVLAGTLGVGASTSVQLADPGSLTAAASASVRGAGRFSWTGGSLIGAITLAPSGGVSVSGATHKQIPNRGSSASAVAITAPVTFAAGTSSNPNAVDLEGRSTLTLAGRSTVRAGVAFSHGQVVNKGSLTVQAAARNHVHVNAAGFVDRGMVSVVSGSFDVDDDFAANAGRLVVAAVAAVSVGGDFTLGSGASAQFGESSRSGGALSAAGRVTLRGRLMFANAGYTPKLKSVRTVLTSGSAVVGRPSCSATSGPGSAQRHWRAAVAGRRLAVTWVAGRQTSC